MSIQVKTSGFLEEVVNFVCGHLAVVGNLQYCWGCSESSQGVKNARFDGPPLMSWYTIVLFFHAADGLNALAPF